MGSLAGSPFIGIGEVPDLRGICGKAGRKLGQFSAPLHIGLAHEGDQVEIGLSAAPLRKQHQNERQRRASHGSPRDRFAPDYDAIMSALGHGPGHSTEPESLQEPNALKSPGRGMLGRGWHLQRDSAGKN
jgi:hypothetical protein